MDGADEEEEEHQRLHFGSLSNTTSLLGGLCATELTAGDHQQKNSIFVNNSICENNWEIFVSLILSISDENGLCITEEKKQTNVTWLHFDCHIS